jgi:8-oxo-dGTP pyrophosphatase MutT (NUDIX family)
LLRETHRCDLQRLGVAALREPIGKNREITVMGRWVDRCWRAGLVAAYAGIRAYWFVFRPRTRGVFVALWFEGQLLFIRNSYRSKLSLPGGGVDRGEEVVDAAVRELREEVGISVEARELRLVKTYVIDEDHHVDHSSIFEIELSQAPLISIDCREVVWAGFETPGKEELDSSVTALRLYLKSRMG